MKTIVKSVVLGLLLIALILLGHSLVSANAVPPPAKLWFTFVYPTEPHPRLEGVQWIFCADEACITPTFVQTHGVCELPGCVSGAASPRVTFACAEDLCLATLPYGEPATVFQLIAQFSDGVRASAPITGLALEWGDEYAWQVQVQGTELVLTEDTAFVPPESTRGDFLSGFALTLVVELLVVGVGLYFWKKAEHELLGARLLLVGLINLLSYPLVWLVFPAWTQFQPRYLRTMSIWVSIAWLIYAAALLWIYLPKDKSMRRLALIVTALSLPVTALCLVFVLVVVGYGNYAVAVPGLPYGWMLLLTETFVVVIEAALLFFLSRKSLTLVEAGILSLVMNLASFLVGQVVFH